MGDARRVVELVAAERHGVPVRQANAEVQSGRAVDRLLRGTERKREAAGVVEHHDVMS